MCIFGNQKTPDPPAPAAPPRPVNIKPTSAATHDAVADQKARAKRHKGTKSTIMTSPLGMKDKAQTERKTLMGM